MTRGRLKPSGFSILEMLVVCVLIGLVTTVVVLLFTKGNQIYKHGEAHIEMQRNGRHMVSRLSPYIGSMFDRDDATVTPMRSPPNAGTSSPELVFNTTEDWFSPAYPSAATSAMLAPSVSALGKFTYRVRLVSDTGDVNNGNVVLERIDGDGATPPYVVTSPSINNTRIIWRPRVGESIENFRFEWPNILAGDLIRLTFTTVTTTRGDTGQPVEVREDFRVTFTLPKDT